MKAKHLVMPTNQNGLGWWAAIHHKKSGRPQGAYLEARQGIYVTQG